MTDIDKLGEEVAALIKGAEKDKAKIAPMLRKVWAELEAKKPVNGVANKSAWAQKHGVTLRYCQYIVKDGSRKDQKKKDANSVRVKSGFLARIADAKKKLTDIQQEINAPFTESEPRDFKPLYARINPACHEVFQEFLALIAPDGYEVIFNGRHWSVSEREQGPISPTPKPAKPQATKNKKPVKHANQPGSYHLSWCRTALNQNNAAHQARYATCPYCLAASKAGLWVIHPVMKRRAIEKDLKEHREGLARHESVVHRCLPEHRDKKYQRSVEAITEYREKIAKLEQELAAIKGIKTPEQAVEAAKKARAEREAEREAQRKAAAQQPAPTEKPTPAEVMTDRIRIKLTAPQRREVDALAGFSDLWDGWNRKVMVFVPAHYQEEAKALVLALEERIKELNRELAPLTCDSGYMDWTNREPAALAHRKKVSGLQGARKACEGAIRTIVNGDLNSDGTDGRDLCEWQNQRDEARHQRVLNEISEPAKALAAVVGDDPVDVRQCRKELMEIGAAARESPLNECGNLDGDDGSEDEDEEAL